MKLVAVSILLVALAAAPAQSVRDDDAARSLQASVAAAIHDAETMAVKSGQPSQNVVMEIAKAIRNVIWTSGAAPSLVVSSLQAAETSEALSPQALQAVRIVEKEMSE